MAAFTALQLFLLNNQVKRADLFDVGVSNATCKEPKVFRKLMAGHLLLKLNHPEIIQDELNPA